MENLGSLAILLAFCLAVSPSSRSVAGGWKRNAFLIGQRASARSTRSGSW